MGAATKLNDRIRDLEAEVERLRPYAEAHGGERALPTQLRALANDLDYVLIYGVKREGVSRNPIMQSRPPYDVGNERLRVIRREFHRDLEAVARKYEAQLDRLIGQDWQPALSDGEVERWLKGMTP